MAPSDIAAHDWTKQEPNARGEPRPIAGATQERTLSGVGSTALLGLAPASFDAGSRFAASAAPGSND